MTPAMTPDMRNAIDAWHRRFEDDPSIPPFDSGRSVASHFLSLQLAAEDDRWHEAMLAFGVCVGWHRHGVWAGAAQYHQPCTKGLIVDLRNDVLIQLVNKQAGSFIISQPGGPYLHGISMNCARDHFKKANRVHGHEVVMPDHFVYEDIKASDVVEEVVKTEIRDLARKTIKSLRATPGVRHAVQDQVAAGSLTRDEAARILGMERYVRDPKAAPAKSQQMSDSFAIIYVLGEFAVLAGWKQERVAEMAGCAAGNISRAIKRLMGELSVEVRNPFRS